MIIDIEMFYWVILEISLTVNMVFMLIFLASWLHSNNMLDNIYGGAVIVLLFILYFYVFTIFIFSVTEIFYKNESNYAE